jgi:hypothetical protein
VQKVSFRFSHPRRHDMLGAIDGSMRVSYQVIIGDKKKKNVVLKEGRKDRQ